MVKDRARLRLRLEEILARLDTAEAVTGEAAARYAERTGDPSSAMAHARGGLEQIVKASAAELRALITIHLPETRRKGPRT